jgi:hypothetical protein
MLIKTNNIIINDRVCFHDWCVVNCNNVRFYDDVLFIGTRFSNLYTAVDTPA